MPSIDVMEPSGIAPSFRGEPGQESPDAIGGWDADSAFEYRQFALRSELQEFAMLYGWHAVEQEIHAVKNGEVE